MPQATADADGSLILDLKPMAAAACSLFLILTAKGGIMGQSEHKSKAEGGCCMQ